MAVAMIGRLRRLIDNPSDVSWSISRVFWRVGQLNLKEAAPYLIRLQDAADNDMKRYTYAWALCRATPSARPSIDLLFDIEQIMNLSKLTKSLAQIG